MYIKNWRKYNGLMFEILLCNTMCSINKRPTYLMPICNFIIWHNNMCSVCILLHKMCIIPFAMTSRIIICEICFLSGSEYVYLIFRLKRRFGIIFYSKHTQKPKTAHGGRNKLPFQNWTRQLCKRNIKYIIILFVIYQFNSPGLTRVT